MLFTGDFKRSGVDLILSKNDQELVLHDYFKGERRAALSSPDGAHLTGNIVDALTGHTQFAQADGRASVAKVIGHVTKLVGTATAIRNGVSIVLTQGDNVEKGDVVQSGSDSRLGITFIDGSVFGLGQNARMVLNEMVYDPNGSNNSSLLSLVAGTISFVAGETAKHGDMKVDTPVAIMGIRGTAVLVEIDFQIPLGVPPPVGPTPAASANFQVLVEPDGSTGSYILFDKTTLAPIATVNQAGTRTSITGQGVVSFDATAPLSPDAQKIITDVFSLKFTDLFNPRTNTALGSSPIGVSGPLVKLASGEILASGEFVTPITFLATDKIVPGTLVNQQDTSIFLPIFVKAVDVIPVADKPSFAIADQVQITDSNSSDPITPYVPGTAKILSVVGPSNIPAGVVLAKLVTVDPVTGVVHYDPANFAFLGVNQKVVVTIGFDSKVGSDTFHEILNVTIDGVKPVFGGNTATEAGEEGGLVTLGATIDSAISVTITGLAHDLSDFSGGTYSAGTGSWTGTAAEFNALTFKAREDGAQHLTITATTAGAEAGATTQSYTLAVAPIQENPGFGGNTATNANEEGGQVTLGATVATHDADDGAISVTITGLAHDLSDFSGGSYTSSTGSWTGTAAEFNALTFKAGKDGTQNLTITATTAGAEAGATTQSYTLVVKPVAEGPIVSGTIGTATEHDVVTLGLSDALPDGDGTLGNVTITGLAHDLSDFSGGSYTASTGTWTGTAAEFNALTFRAGEDGTQDLTITATTSGAEASSTTQSYTLVITEFTDPAGVAGSAINLGLTQPAGAGSGAVTVTGSPLNWTLDGATHNADGSWTVQTNDFSKLTITPDVGFVGAAVLNVMKSWTNSDGSVGSPVVSDNVEAYAPGSPVFAVAGDDHLTGTATGNLFVFAQPFGNDIIYNFNATSDKIDLIGFKNIANFADIQGHITDDANGNAVIKIGAHETITVGGVHAASLTAADFVFNQEPITENPGTMQIGDGAHLAVSSTINNTGAIELSSTGDRTALQLIEHGVTLTGAGHVVLSDSVENAIGGTNADVTLTNVDNTISGAGQIGAGRLTLINEGTIDATAANSLTVDTGVKAVTNSGTLEATGSGGLIVRSDVFNRGFLWANGGNVTLEGNVSGNGSTLISGSATLEFAAASAENTAFASGSTGTLMLDHAVDFSGIVSGMAASNHLDLLDFNFADGPKLNYTANADGRGGTLSITDGAHTANIALLGQLNPAGFQLGADHGTGTLISYHDILLV